MRGLLRSEEPRDLQLWLNGQRVETWTIGKDLERRAGPVMELPPGASVLELRSSTPPTGAGAERPLGFVFYGIELDVLAEALPPSSSLKLITIPVTSSVSPLRATGTS